VGEGPGGLARPCTGSPLGLLIEMTPGVIIKTASFDHRTIRPLFLNAGHWHRGCVWGRGIPQPLAGGFQGFGI
jgi:hypothetical protein